MSAKKNLIGVEHVIVIIVIAVSMLYVTLMISYPNTGYVAVIVECKKEGESITIPIPSRPNSSITLTFIHSVHKTPQVEIVEVTHGGLFLREVRFKEYGAGIPASPHEIGGGVIYESEGFIVYGNLNMPLGYSLHIDLKNAFNMSIKFNSITITKAQCDFITISILSAP